MRVGSGYAREAEEAVGDRARETGEDGATLETGKGSLENETNP